MSALRGLIQRRAVRSRISSLRKEIDLITRISSVVDENLKAELVLDILKEIRRLECSEVELVETHHELTLE